MGATTKHPEGDPPEYAVNLRDLDEDAPRLEFTRRNVFLFLVFVVATIAFLYYVLPQLAGLEDTWERIEEGNVIWLFVALVMTFGSFAGYVVLFQAVFVRAGSPIDLRASYQITMAGLAAIVIW
jgi:uncharacterized membrane protein YbhN (UPF0104 family)